MFSTSETNYRNVPVADLQKGFAQQLTQLDPQRAQSIAGLATARAAKTTTLAHEQRLAVRKYGVASARVGAIEASQMRNAKLATALGMETIRAQTPAPMVTAQSYVFHGFVRDPGGQPIQGITIALFDAHGQWQRDYGYGCSDPNGYFRLDRAADASVQPGSVPPPPAAKGPAGAGAPPPMTAPPPPQPPSTVGGGSDVGGSGGGATPSVVLAFDAKKTLLHREPDLLYPQLGHVDYRVIVLGGENLCTPPPDQTPSPTPQPKPTIKTSLREIASLRQPSVRPRPTPVAPPHSAKTPAPSPKSAAPTAPRAAAKDAAAKDSAEGRKRPRHSKKKRR